MPLGLRTEATASNPYWNTIEIQRGDRSNDQMILPNLLYSHLYNTNGSLRWEDRACWNTRIILCAPTQDLPGGLNSGRCTRYRCSELAANAAETSPNLSTNEIMIQSRDHWYDRHMRFNRDWLRYNNTIEFECLQESLEADITWNALMLAYIQTNCTRRNE
jgi:hypothetical protein